MPVILGGLVPHPPLLVPEVGGRRVEQVARTRDALRSLCREAAGCSPRLLVVVTPHGPYQRSRMSCLGGTRVRGDLSRFGCPDVVQEWRVDEPLAERVAREAARREVPMDLLGGVELDHALFVPLYYLREAGLDCPVVALCISGLPRRTHWLLGEAVAHAVGDVPTVLLASGDLSHRLLEEGPYGFNPAGPVFDRQVVEHLDPLDPDALVGIPEPLVEEAGVCGMKPLMVLLGGMGSRPTGRVLSYEGPFGVGYAVARLDPARAPNPDPVELAEQAVRHWVATGKELEVPEPPPGMADPCGVFVTIRRRNGDLRGCIGTLSPTCPDRAREVVRNAVAAARRDPRFPPVKPAELDDLTYAVYYLDPPEPTREDELNPEVYGVILHGPDGQTGVLLPGIPGIDSGERQLAAVRQKAGVGPRVPVTLERFRVHKFGQDEGS